MSFFLKDRVSPLPSLFTVGNLLCGFWAVVNAFQGRILFACWLVVIAGVLDLADGLLARVTGETSDFGAELDSLADLVSFGLAPSLIVYQHFLQDQAGWEWALAFLFPLAGALRLARFNVEKEALERAPFSGLPITIAGVTVASFLPFSETGFFNQHFLFLPQGEFLVGLMLTLTLLMVSRIEYPLFPRIGLHRPKEILAFAGILIIWMGIISHPSYIFFPLTFLYTMWGLSRGLVVAVLHRGREEDYLPREWEE